MVRPEWSSAIALAKSAAKPREAALPALAELLSATGQSLSLIATRNATFSRQVRPAGDEAPAASAAGRRSLSLSSECESCADVRRDRRLSRSAEESRRSSKEDPCSKATRSQLVAAGASLLLVVHGSRPRFRILVWLESKYEILPEVPRNLALGRRVLGCLH